MTPPTVCAWCMTALLPDDIGELCEPCRRSAHTDRCDDWREDENE